MDSKVAELPVTDRFWAWFEENRQQATLGVVVIVVVGAIVGFYIWHKNEKQVAAGQALSAVALNLGGGRTEAPDAYLKVAAEYPSSQAAAQAVLMAAGAQFTEGKYDQAKATFERFSREFRDNPLNGQALLGIATCLDAQNKTNEAVTAYRDLVEHHPSDSAVPQGKFSLARIYEAQNKPEAALTLFEDVARTDPYGSLGSESGMRLEELKLKYPNLVPPPIQPVANPLSIPRPGKTPMIPGMITNSSTRSNIVAPK